MTPQEWSEAIGLSIVAAAVVLVAIITAGRKVLAAWRELLVERATVEAAGKLAKIEEQVVNSHGTNLRNDLDKANRNAADALAEARLAKESAHRTESLVKDLVVTLRSTEHSVERHTGLQAKAVEEVREDLTLHIGEVPEVVEDALGKARRIAAEMIADHERRHHDI